MESALVSVSVLSAFSSYNTSVPVSHSA